MGVGPSVCSYRYKVFACTLLVNDQRQGAGGGWLTVRVGPTSSSREGGRGSLCLKLETIFLVQLPVNSLI